MEGLKWNKQCASKSLALQAGASSVGACNAEGRGLPHLRPALLFSERKLAPGLALQGSGKWGSDTGGGSWGEVGGVLQRHRDLVVGPRS